LTIDGNAGDRNNLTLWNGGDALIKAVAGANNNTVVILHTVGPVLIDYAKAHPNITAILWAGLPGQESGRSLVDVLYGAVNPQGRSPFTWAKQESDYGPQLLYKSTTNPPSQEFTEGVFIDYRHFQKAHIEPLWEFGFGLSYTDFRYENISVTPLKPAAYRPAGGMTAKAPAFGNTNRSAAANALPEGFARVNPYIYPWLNGTTVPEMVAAPATSKTNGSAQPVLPAGGSPGGNKGLYEDLYKIEFMARNVGKVAGVTVPQLVSISSSFSLPLPSRSIPSPPLGSCFRLAFIG
jgi:beta-glucosidase